MRTIKQLEEDIKELERDLYTYGIKNKRNEFDIKDALLKQTSSIKQNILDGIKNIEKKGEICEFIQKTIDGM